MNIQYTKVGPSHGLVAVTFDEPDYVPIVEKKIKHYAQNLRLKGFRYGAVPLAFVRKTHGPEILSEVVHKLAEEALQDYLKKEQLPIFIESLLVESPTGEALQKGGPLTFAYEIGLIEKQEIALGEHLSVTEFQIDRVEDGLVDAFLEGIALTHGKAVDLSESSEDALLLGSVRVREETEWIPTRLAVNRFPQSARAPFVGLTVGSEVPLTKELWQTHAAAHLGIAFDTYAALSKGDFPYTFRVEGIKKATPAPLTTELFDLVLGPGVADSEEDFRAAVSQVILFDKRMQAKYAFHADLRDLLFEHVPLNLPDAFLKKWLTAKNPEASLTEIERYYQESREGLRWEILLSALIRQNNLAVREADLLEEAKRTCLKQLKEKAEPEELAACDEEALSKRAIDFLKRDNGKNYFSLHERLSRERAIEFIKQNIRYVVETVSAEAFDARR